MDNQHLDRVYRLADEYERRGLIKLAAALRAEAHKVTIIEVELEEEKNHPNDSFRGS